MGHYEKYNNFKELAIQLRAEADLNEIKLANSVHMNYYAIVQLIQYILIKKLNTEYPNQDAIREKAKIGYHLFLLKEIRKLIRTLDLDIPESVHLQTNINLLKSKRVIADYSKRNINDINELNKVDRVFYKIESILLKIIEE